MRKITLTTLLLFTLVSTVVCHDKKPTDSEKEIIVKLGYKFTINGHVDWMRIKMMIPHSIKNRQQVNKITYSTEPDSLYEKNGNTYALFRLYDINDNFSISWKADMIIYRVIPGQNDNMDSIPAKYTMAETYIQSDDTDIITVAKTLKKKTDIETVINTFSYVKDHIIYKLQAATGADSVLKSGEGKCMDFSDLFNALLRANRIPAKSVYGMTMKEDDYPGYHAWSEVYLKKQGWILFDPTTGHSDITIDGQNYKMRIANKYVILSEGRNDTELHLKRIYFNYYKANGTTIKFKETSSIVDK
jgi:transglutaminase-like putative cysteine protease